jgi:AcrR family transcriptional regulator
MPPVPPDATPRAPRGRPRSEQARRAILAAALELVRADGYAAATIDAVARRAGVARTTIYRWWPSGAALLVDVLVDILATDVAPVPVGNDPLRAIRLEMRRTASVSAKLPGRLLLSLLGEAENDPRVRVAILERLAYPRRERTARAIREAQARGLLRDDLHPYVIRDLFLGPLFYRLIVGHDSVTERFATQVYERVLAGLAPEGKRGKRKT